MRDEGERTLPPTHLPAEDPEGPDVRLGGETCVVEDLWRRPLDGELGAAVGRVLVVDDVPGQAEVCHLRDNGYVLKIEIEPV